MQCLLSGCAGEAAASLQGIAENITSRILVEHFVGQPYPIDGQGLIIRIRRPGDMNQVSAVITESLGVIEVLIRREKEAEFGHQGEAAEDGAGIF